MLLSLLILLQATLSTARAEEGAAAPAAEDPAAEEEPAPPPPEEEEEPDEVMTIEAERVLQARDALRRDLAALGYRPGRSRDGRTKYVPYWKERWKPKIIVDDDGWMTFRSPRVVAQPPRIKLVDVTDDAQTYAPAGPRRRLEVSWGFWMTSRRVLLQQEQILADALTPALRDLNDAIGDAAFVARLTALPEILDAAWLEGRTPEGAPLAEMPARRQYIRAMCESRTDTPEGRMMQRAIADYIEAVIQTSDAPFPPEERGGPCVP